MQGGWEINTDKIKFLKIGSENGFLELEHTGQVGKLALKGPEGWVVHTPLLAPMYVCFHPP